MAKGAGELADVGLEPFGASLHGEYEVFTGGIEVEGSPRNLACAAVPMADVFNEDGVKTQGAERGRGIDLLPHPAAPVEPRDGHRRGRADDIDAARVVHDAVEAPDADRNADEGSEQDAGAKDQGDGIAVEDRTSDEKQTVQKRKNADAGADEPGEEQGAINDVRVIAVGRMKGHAEGESLWGEWGWRMKIFGRAGHSDRIARMGISRVACAYVQEWSAHSAG